MARQRISWIIAAIVTYTLVACQSSAPGQTPREIITTATPTGSQVRVPSPSKLQDPLQCHPFEPSRYNDVEFQRLRTHVYRILPQAVWELFDRYLTPGVGDPSRVEVTSVKTIDEFRNSEKTKNALQKTLDRAAEEIEAKRPALNLSLTSSAGHTLASLGIGEHVPIAWRGFFNIPGLIAGGVGGVESQASGGSFRDDRTITGRYLLTSDLSSRGVVKTVTLEFRSLQLDVNDSIDFCPGNLAGNKGIWLGLTLEMSRFERTPNGQGSYANPVLWHLRTPLPDSSHDLSKLYSNDPDSDGWPDKQPWDGAGYTLDNCPGVYNPDQADSVGDGVGDACRKPSSTLASPSTYTTVPPDNSVPPDNHDPQIISFTNSAPTECTRDQPYSVTFKWQVLNATIVRVEPEGVLSSRTFSPTDSLTLRYLCNDWPHVLYIDAIGANGGIVGDVNVVSPNPVGGTSP